MGLAGGVMLPGGWGNVTAARVDRDNLSWGGVALASQAVGGSWWAYPGPPPWTDPHCCDGAPVDDC